MGRFTAKGLTSGFSGHLIRCMWPTSPVAHQECLAFVLHWVQTPGPATFIPHKVGKWHSRACQEASSRQQVPRTRSAAVLLQPLLQQKASAPSLALASLAAWQRRPGSSRNRMTQPFCTGSGTALRLKPATPARLVAAAAEARASCPATSCSAACSSRAMRLACSLGLLPRCRITISYRLHISSLLEHFNRFLSTCAVPSRKVVK
eukprot:6177725-Pleurochrysis_carterae.AAC.2